VGSWVTTTRGGIASLERIDRIRLPGYANLRLDPIDDLLRRRRNLRRYSGGIQGCGRPEWLESHEKRNQERGRCARDGAGHGCMVHEGSSLPPPAYGRRPREAS
jgi:hypothetical protein